MTSHLELYQRVRRNLEEQKALGSLTLNNHYQVTEVSRLQWKSLLDNRFNVSSLYNFVHSQGIGVIHCCWKERVDGIKTSFKNDVKLINRLTFWRYERSCFNHSKALWLV